MWEGKGFRGFHTIEYKSKLYNLLDKSSLPPVVIKKVVLEYNHIICFHIVMSAELVITIEKLYRKSFLTPYLELCRPLYFRLLLFTLTLKQQTIKWL